MNNNEDKKVLIIIIIYLLIILVIIGFLIYRINQDSRPMFDNNNEIRDDINNDDSSNATGYVKLEDVIASSNIASDVINEIIDDLENFNLSEIMYSGNSNFSENFGLLYKKQYLLINELPKDIKMAIVASSFDFSELELEKDDYYFFKININEFEKQYYKILGKSVNYEPISVNFYPYVEVRNNSIYIPFGGEVNGPGYSFAKNLIKAEQINGEIYLYENVVIRYENMDTGVNTYYADFELNNLLATGLKEEEVFEKYSDQLSQYKYTFKLEDGNYYFYSVEKVK